MLESLEAVKKQYQAETTNAQTGTPPVVEATTSGQQALREAEERSKFEKSSFVQAEALKAFKEIKRHEFRLLSMYKPHKLAQNFEGFLKEMTEQERTSSLKVDKALLTSSD